MVTLITIFGAIALFLWLSNKRLKGIINDQDKKINELSSKVVVETYKVRANETRLQINEDIGGLDCGGVRGGLSKHDDFRD